MHESSWDDESGLESPEKTGTNADIEALEAERDSHTKSFDDNIEGLRQQVAQADAQSASETTVKASEAYDGPVDGEISLRDIYINQQALIGLTMRLYDVLMVSLEVSGPVGAAEAADLYRKHSEGDNLNPPLYIPEV